MVPTEVPIEIEIKRPITNRPMTAMPGGIRESPRLTVLSAPPAAVIEPEKAPAARKNQAHGDDVVVADAFRRDGKLFVEGLAFCLQKSNNQGD